MSNFSLKLIVMNEVIMMERPWHKEYPEAIPFFIEEEPQLLPTYLYETTREYPEKIAIHFLGKEISFLQLEEYVMTFASYLQKLGVQKGDHISIMLPNCPQAIICYYGILMTGGVVVQTNPLYTERELEFQLNDSESTMIICLDMFCSKVQQIKSNLQHIIVTSIADFLPFPKNVLYPFIQKIDKVEFTHTTHRMKEILQGSRKKLQEIEMGVEDIAVIQYTGGTTGTPKGVMLTHRNLAINTIMTSKWLYKMEKGSEVILGALPLFHVYGMTAIMNISIMQAYKMILIPRFQVEDILKTIQRQKPTVFPGAPTMYIALINHPHIHQYDLSSIEACVSGSAALPVEVQNKFEQLTSGKLVEGYGLSESSPITHSNFVWGERVKGSIGVPWPSTDAKIISLETGEDMEIGEIGEIVVKGPQVMVGYWNRPTETTEVLTEDGWLKTGDMGYMDSNGYFYIVDRKKDLIIAGGLNVYPREIEEVLFEHEKVREVAVIGVADEYRGETVKAFIVLKDGMKCTEKELDEYMRQNLASYKVPKIYEFREELPKSMIGKVLKRLLIEK